MLRVILDDPASVQPVTRINILTKALFIALALTLSISQNANIAAADTLIYAWRKRQSQPSPRQQRRNQMDDAVKKAFEAKKGRFGSPGLTRDLADAGQHYDRKTVAASMRRQGLRAKAAKKFKATTNSKHSLPVAANLLQQDFTAKAPNQKYVSDITYCAPILRRCH